MNTYYLRKLRKAAKKHVKVELLKRGDKEYLVIATNDATKPLYDAKTNFGRRLFLLLFRLRYPYGQLVRHKEFYAKINGCNRLSDCPREESIITLDYLKREQQIEFLNDARRMYVIDRAQEEKSVRQRIDDIKWQKELMKEKRKEYKELKRM